MPEITYREALRQALRWQLQNDERVFLMGEDIGAYGGSYAVTKGFLEEFGERRVKDTPIAESVVAGAGIGAAMAGLKPMVELMTINFSLLAIDQIVNNASKLSYMSDGQICVPLVIRMAGGAGSQLGAQHSHSLEGWYAHVPGLKVVVPATPYDAKGLLMTAFDDDNPVIFIEHTALYASKGEVPEEPYRIPFGQAELLHEGGDVTLIGYSGSVHQAFRAAQQLAGRGIEADVLNLRTLRPLDTAAILASVRKTHRAIVVEDDWKFGGFGGEIVSIIQEQAFDDLDGPVLRCSGADVPMPYAGSLEQAALPQEDQIVRMALELAGEAA
ncbi:MAG: alpha-ketoacid dehydrogenase subunit beta [Dehalococcoidia bacterium]